MYECIDGTFEREALAYYDKYGVVTPTKGNIYTFREVKKHHIGETGVLLDQINNPKIPVDSPILGKVLLEPTWDINRFRKLQKPKQEVEELTLEEVY